MPQSASRPMNRKSLLRLCFGFVAGLVLVGPAVGQTYTWNNFAGTSGGGVLAWTTPANWVAPPTFTQNATLTFPGSGLQVAGNYTVNADGDNTINSLVFALEGNVQGIGNGQPMVLSIGDGTSFGTIRLNTSSTSVAPSIIQNGAGSVYIGTGVAGSSIAIEGASPVTIGGSGIGLVQIDTAIGAGTTSGSNSGLLINFNPSAVRANNTGASVQLSGSNFFTGDVVLQNGNLAIGSAAALGLSTNRLVVNAGSNSVRLSTTVTIANPVLLNSNMTVTSYDGATSTWTGAWSGVGGLNIQAGIGMTLNLQGAAAFGGPLIVKPLTLGLAGTANNTTVNIGSSNGGATTGSLATNNVQLFAGSVLNLVNTNGNATRLAAGTNLTMYRSTLSLVANATAGNDASEVVASLTNTGMSTILVTPQAATSATLRFVSWNRLSNSTAYFVGTGLGGTPAANVANIVFTVNPGGATPGSTTPGTQNLAVLPYAFGNSVATVTTAAATSLVRYDDTTGRIVPLNTATEYANNQTLANGTGAAGLNYRLAGAGSGGIVGFTGTVAPNGLVIDTAMATPPPVGVALVGSGTLNMTGPVLSTYSGSGFPTGITTYLPNQIAIGGMNFGANTAYFHTLGDLWMSTPISGSGGLVKSADNGGGQANLYLLATNSFTGGLTINAGNIYFTSDANLGAAGGGILMNSGGNGGLVFTQNPFYDSTPAPNATISRPLTLGAANGTLSTIVQNNTLTYSGPISGAGGLVVSTAGVVAVTNAANSFAGDVVVRGGTLIAGSDGALGAASNRILMGAPLSQPIFQPGPGFTSTNRDFLILNTATIFTNGVDLTINGTVASTQTAFGGPGLTKAGLGTLTLTAVNTVGGTITIGEVPGTVVRVSAPNQTQFGGGLRLAGANGSLPMAGFVSNFGALSGFVVNNAAFLTLDNSTTANSDRIGTVPVTLNGGSLNLIGNASTSITERMGAIASGSSGTVTLTQPTSAGGQVTTLVTNSFSPSGTLFVRGTNFGAATGDRTAIIVSPTPANLTSVSGIVLGGFAATSDTAVGPTDFLAATVINVPAPNLNQFSLAPLTTYGSVAAPGATVNANQAGSVFVASSTINLNALRIGAGGGLDLNTQSLVLGTANSNERAGTILAAGGANAGIVGGTVDFGSQTIRIVTTNDLSIGSAANPTTILGTYNSSVGNTFYKAGPGKLTLFGTAATTLAANPTLSGTVTISEGTLVLGNANALGRSTLNSTSVAPIPNVYPSINTQKGSVLDISALSASPVRINTFLGGGDLILGNTTLNTGNSSSNMGGNVTGGSTSKFIVGLAQSDIPFNTFGSGGPALTGDNSGFLGQWVVLRGTLNFASNLSFGTGTSPIQFSDTASNGSTGSVTLRIDAGLTVPFSRDVLVPAGGFALPTFLIGNSSNTSMTGSLTLGKAAGVAGSAGSTGIFTFAGQISGAGQLQLGTSVFGASGNVAFATANPNWTGGLLMNTGQSSSAISGIVGVGADTSFGTGTLTLGQFAGLLRADGAARTLANAIDVFDATPTAAFTTSFGTTGVNDITLTGNVRSSQVPPFNIVPPSVPASPFTHTLNLNAISRGTTTFAGTISNGSAFNFGITKNGPGLVAINGNNSYTGDTVINAGTVRLGNANALGLGGRQAMTAVVGGATINSGAVLDLNGQVGVNKPITLAGGSLVNNGASPASIAGGVVSSLTITTNGNPQTAVPTVTLSGGGGTGATAVASLGLQPASFTFAPLTQGGSGYTSAPAVTITGGGGSGATAQATLGVTAQTFTITNGGSGYTTAPTVSISGSGTSGATTATATSTITGGVVTAITITNAGTGYLFAPTITFGTAPTGGTTATGIGNATNFQVGSVVLTNPGGGFSSAPTFNFSGGGGTGTTVTTNASNFALGLVMTNPGTGYTSAPTVGFSAGTATATANLSSVVVTAASNFGGSGDLTINAAVSGAGSLTKVGSGVAVLTNANTYTGGTTVGAGVLRVNNTTGSGTGTGLLSVLGTGTAGSGGTLTGGGFIGGSVAISSVATATRGGTLAPGNNIGTLTQTTGTMTWSPGGTYVFEHDVSAPVGDLMNGTGSSTLDLSGLSAGSQFNIVLSAVTGFGTPSATPLTYTIATYTGGITAPIGIVGNNLTPYFNVTGNFITVPTVTLVGNSVQIGFQPVPEPATVLLIASAGAGAFGLWRRRRQRS
ncbi:MAG: autotransporter-associated beta strand repeat-containing protein [Gemmataceae bacterium]